MPGCLQDGDYLSRETQILIQHLRRGLPLRVFEQQKRLCAFLDSTLAGRRRSRAWYAAGPISQHSEP
ncbi:hypothetical protein AQJ54_42865 [Streptomyces griseorubiginosus]|uniref:Uncharacterized protein n=1 Tax=Streptomyces griseorubiginosus TaxID=67304 RepID=A0A101RM52_9ACTN|nr:hypothetical protein AQJ54_42865 [Streptomyces griseorubiginosus]